MKRKFYLAYGANTNKRAMSVRCPNGIYIGTKVVPDMKLMFKYVADVVDSKGAETTMALWSICEQCEKALDYFEGFPRSYVKRYINIDVNGVKQRAMLYVMRDGTRVHGSPSRGYWECLTEGYKDCAMPQAQLDAARAEAIAADREAAIAEAESEAEERKAAAAKPAAAKPKGKDRSGGGGRQLALPHIKVVEPAYLRNAVRIGPTREYNFPSSVMGQAFKKAALLQDDDKGSDTK